MVWGRGSREAASPASRIDHPRKRRNPQRTPRRTLGVHDLECSGRRRRPPRSCVQHRQHRPGPPRRRKSRPLRQTGGTCGLLVRPGGGRPSESGRRPRRERQVRAPADQGRDHPPDRSRPPDVRPHLEDPAAGARRRRQPRRHPRGRGSARDGKAHGAVPRRRILRRVRRVRRGGAGAGPASGAQALDHLGGHRPGRRGAHRLRSASAACARRSRRRPTTRPRSTARWARPAGSSPVWRWPPPTSPPSSLTWWRSRTWR